MKKLLFTVLILLSLPAYAAESAQESAYDRVIRTGVLKCGYLLYPPLLMKDAKTGEMSGVAYDLVKEIASRLSLKVEWTEEVGTDVMLQGLETGRYDAFCLPMFASSARARVAYFTDPVFFATTYVVTAANDHRFDQNPMLLNDPQYKIASLEGEASSILARQRFSKATSHSVPQIQGYSFVLKDVAIGKADATISDLISITDYNKENSEKLKVLKPALFKHELAFALPRDISLKLMFDTTIHEMLTEEWVELTLAKKYPDYWAQVIPAAPRYTTEERAKK